MKKYFRTIQNVMDSRWGNFQYAGMPAAQKTDRVLQSSKLEDCIYRDLSRDDENMENIQQEAASMRPCLLLRRELPQRERTKQAEPLKATDERLKGVRL